MVTKGIAAVLSVLAFIGSSVQAENAVGVDLSADFFGKYIWRGQNLTNSTVFQPGVGIAYGGFTGSIWGNMDMTAVNGNRYDFTEYDFSIDYSGAVPGIEGVAFSVGAIYYRFPSVKPSSTTELYWGFSFDLPLSPSVTVYHDVDEADGTYVSVGVGHAIDELFSLSPEMPVGLEIGAAMGWGDSDYNDYYWEVKNSKLNDLTVTIAFSVEVGGWTVSPSVSYIKLLSDSLRATNQYAGKSDYVVAGISLSQGF